MKIFDRNGKINFIDDNNVLVGFDNNQQCCESFDWNIRETPHRDSAPIPGVATKDGFKEYPGFNFDTSVQLGVPCDDEYEMSAVAFRLANGQEEIFLILENSHNGYYSHGFDMRTGNNETLFDGIL